MPYITKEARERIAQGGEPLTTGDLNYMICRAAAFPDTQSTVGKILRVLDLYRRNELQSYDRLNDIMGALDGARRELRRRSPNVTGIRLIEHAQEQFYRETVAPYEDEAIKRNGDIFK